eukprot:3028721-Alexandrium_andersonii.AAC.1
MCIRDSPPPSPAPSVWKAVPASAVRGDAAGLPRRPLAVAVAPGGVVGGPPIEVNDLGKGGGIAGEQR